MMHKQVQYIYSKNTNLKYSVYMAFMLKESTRVKSHRDVLLPYDWCRRLDQFSA
jgi:hypothetical protein